ncbi:MAG: hypothetical protein ABJO67_13030, partial [Pseudoruegeria sp.]
KFGNPRHESGGGFLLPAGIFDKQRACKTMRKSDKSTVRHDARTTVQYVVACIGKMRKLLGLNVI